MLKRQRGRPEIDGDNKKTRLVAARMNEESYKRLLKVLEKESVSMSDFVRTCVENAVDGYLERLEMGYDDGY